MFYLYIFKTKKILMTTTNYNNIENTTTMSKNNNMNAKVNKNLNYLPENLKLNGTTPSGKLRLFVCKICTRAFARQEHLDRHERSHTKEKPYECGICDKTFSRRDLLIRHAQKVHGGNCGDSIKRKKIKSLSSQSTTNNDIIKRRNSKSINKTVHQRKNDKSRKNSIATTILNSPNSSNSSNSNSNSLTSSPLIETTAKTTPFSDSPIPLFGLTTSTITDPDYINNNNNNQFNSRRRGRTSKNPIQKRRLIITPGSSNDNSNQSKKLNNSNSIEDQELKHENLKNHKFARRASFSAQSAENYAATLFKTDEYHYERVQFSTPELLPADFRVFWNQPFLPIENIDTFQLDDSNTTTNHYNYNTQGIPPEFCLSDTVNLINNNDIPQSSDNKSSDSDNNSSESLIKKNTFKSTSFVSTSQSETPIFTDIQNNHDSHDNNYNNIPKYQDKHKNQDENENTGSPRDIMNTLMSISTPVSLQDPFSADLEDIDYSTMNLNQNNIDMDKIAIDSQNIFQNYIKNEESKTSIFSTVNFDDPLTIIENLPCQNGNDTKDNYSFYGVDYMTVSNISKASPPGSNKDNISYIKENLFTSKLRDYCNSVLNYYKSNCYNSGGSTFNPDPTLLSKELLIPSCNEMNYFLTLFKKHFLRHYPFIHPTILNLDFISFQRYLYEDENLTTEAIDTMERNNDMIFIARTVCLPLSMATFGSLYKNGFSPKTLILFEISRRAVHVYLECKKESYLEKKRKIDIQCNDTLQDSTQHAWLIQVLILNVIFGFFADESKHVNDQLVKRQVSGVCKVVKKNILRSVSVGFSGNNNQNLSFSSKVNYILFETKVRCILLLYRYCQYLKIFYKIESKLFLTEGEIDNVSIPDTENKWLSYSLMNNNDNNLFKDPVEKQYFVPFTFFYHSFSFNDRGLHAIPEYLASSMLYYEYNTRKSSTFHIFLTRIDTKKLELNLPNLRSSSNTYDLSNNDTVNENNVDNPNDLVHEMIADSETLISDSIVLKNCLMVMQFFELINKHTGVKFWSGTIDHMYELFLSPANINLLAEGSYTLLTDFLVALNFSIQNLSKLLVFDKNTNNMEFNSEVFSVFNFQGIYYNFLIIIKFLLDFEATPNFKLLSIFTELKKLANQVLIPKLSNLYPNDFTKFGNSFKTSTNHMGNDQMYVTNESTFSTLNIERISKIINDVIVYSFNDSSFLNMADQTNNEFMFEQEQNNRTLFNFAERIQNGNDIELQENFQKSNSSFNLLLHHSRQSIHNKHNDNKKQSFAVRYQLSLKYTVIAKCLFTGIVESHVHYSLLSKMSNDFGNLEKFLDLVDNETTLSKFHLAQ